MRGLWKHGGTEVTERPYRMLPNRLATVATCKTSLCLCDSVFQTDCANLETQSHRGHGVISEGVSQLVMWGGFPETGVLTRVLHIAYYYIWAIYT